jgi:plasmid stabilization system protein ParE
MKSVIILDIAAQEIEEAIDFYAKVSQGLDMSFIARITDALQLIEQFPDAGTPLDVSPESSTRRVLVKGFPYALFYRAYETESRVIAFGDTRRQPRFWRNR